jgi:uncharacterized protein YcgL (UPF0745 family)
MLCYIYKSKKKDGAYLYLVKKDDFSQLPEELLALFGQPYFVMVIKLEGRALAQVDIEKVTESLNEQGFFLQLPPPVENVLELHKAQKARLN